MKKSKKKKGLSRLFEIAGQKKGLLVLAGSFSAGSAVCILVPYWAVYEVLKELLSHGGNPSTVIVIAHRLSSIISTHQIVVMKEGRVVQCGQHDALSVAEGVYKNMWDAYTSAYHWTLNKN